MKRLQYFALIGNTEMYDMTPEIREKTVRKDGLVTSWWKKVNVAMQAR